MASIELMGGPVASTSKLSMHELGIDGTYVRFKQPVKILPYRTHRRGEIVTHEKPPSADGIVFALPSTTTTTTTTTTTATTDGLSIDATTRDLCHRISELGWLYRTIMTSLANEPRGTVQQALSSAIHAEMVGYFKLLAALEARLDLPLEQEGLTLRRLEKDLDEWKLRLRMMSTLVTEASDTRTGGAYLTMLYERTSNGDPFIKSFCSNLLKTLCVPFLKTLSSWIYQGELQDPFGEFFVSLNPDVTLSTSTREEGIVDDIRADAEREDKAGVLWKDKFLWRGDMLPAFLEESFGRKIYSTGKSLNFLKYSCQDASWVHAQTSTARELDYSSFPSLSASIQTAYSVASQRLFDVFLDKFDLLEHLKALKAYLLLGKGDFVESLMDNLGPSLNRPANTLYRHNLTSTLEGALRSSVPTPTEDVLRRLDARMADTGAGELGWDVFTLEYKVSSPLDTVIDDDSMDAYARVFKHLWHVKRVEKTLEGAWTRLMSVKRWSRDPNLAFELHQTRLALSSMLFFVRQIEAYCHLEVIECSWIPLAEFLDKKEGDLDALVQEHKRYLDRIVNKTLLQGGKRRKEGRESLLDQLKLAWKAMLKFSDAVDALCNFAISEAARADDASKGLATSRALARSTSSEALQAIIARLSEQSSDFKSLAASMVSGLGAASDLDMRFLAVRLNFNYAFVNPNKPE